jgi:hypothetical protein
MAWLNPLHATSPTIPKGPVTWGLAGCLLAGASVLLACFSPLLLAGVAVLSLAAIGMTAADGKKSQAEEEQAESWRDSTIRMAACIDCLEREPESQSRKFQEMLLSQERDSSYRLH